MREGIDFSGKAPSVVAVRNAGKDFVIRYARSFTHPKSITSAERQAWQAAGIDIVIVDESSADRALAGRTAGQNDARAARSAIVAIGGPVDGVIYTAVDFDVAASQMGTVLDYLRGWGDILGPNRVGVYGKYDVVKAANETRVCKYLWQTYAWSGGRVYPGIQLYQYRNGVTLGGVEVDYNRTSQADFGQWIQPTTSAGDDGTMAWSDQDSKNLSDLLGAVRDTYRSGFKSAAPDGQTDDPTHHASSVAGVNLALGQVNDHLGAIHMILADVAAALEAALAGVAAPGVPVGAPVTEQPLAATVAPAAFSSAPEMDTAPQTPEPPQGS